MLSAKEVNVSRKLQGQKTEPLEPGDVTTLTLTHPERFVARYIIWNARFRKPVSLLVKDAIAGLDLEDCVDLPVGPKRKETGTYNIGSRTVDWLLDQVEQVFVQAGVPGVLVPSAVTLTDKLKQANEPAKQPEPTVGINSGSQEASGP